MQDTTDTPNISDSPEPAGGAQEASRLGRRGIGAIQGEAAPAVPEEPSALHFHEARPEDIKYVDTSRINLPEDISGPEDFRGKDPQETYDSMRREMLMQDEMRPLIEQGAPPDTWEQWDKEKGLGHYSTDNYVRGYEDVYGAFYKNDTIALEPAGDRYNILNGRHRVHLAHDLGIPQVPACVVE
ncbi:MAG TPA: hypothetical protein VF707_09920 [Ardenticatenaceae bacterium]|jgi:hypothetical protein